MGGFVKVKEGERYQGGAKKILHICSICHGDWDVAPGSILEGTYMCKECCVSVRESLMAKVVKQVLKHYYPQTKFEYDLGFRGKNGGVSAYDAYVPEINTVFEFQSAYHDDEESKEDDYKKMKYAIENKKCNYLAIDHRNYTPLKAIQFLFPWIEEIPNYVDVSKDTTRRWDIKQAQELLNQHLSYQEIAKVLDIKPHCIQDAVRRGFLIKPKGYMTVIDRCWDIDKAQKLLNLKKYTHHQIAKKLGNGCTEGAIRACIFRGLLIKPEDTKLIIPERRVAVVQLETDGTFYKEYESCSLVNGFNYHSISSACKGEYYKIGHFYAGYLWFYKSEYEEMLKKYGKIHVADALKNKQLAIFNPDSRKILQVSLNGEIVNEYDKIIHAEKEGFNRKSISIACQGKSGKNEKNGHSYKGYLWYYKADYENGKFELQKCTNQQKKAVVQLNFDGSFHKEYHSLNSADGFRANYISKACKGGAGHKYKGFLWYFKTEYEEMIKESTTVAM
ncbi:hypothetical protein PP175_25510 (plasmid) [Aneurinibacillus sp. Ricciae_BoGa-3]|uniref:hypothetical protein n=1 Tax=Aneurinibacillus sp. Ricciae_BoGa-3 TaxID=3022697 RepID=UPI002341FBD9|nr:hypothetical protein [Aneurinibacillus sp. Ricciae_BoGa-3]WCK57428.1 hypothetical protein PP175_25510 [Aneurinibacillus sp. Ricciae_BoGa-3]